MCGIIGYVGDREAYDVLVSGLERLEYRGYDSAGICIQSTSSLLINKLKGRVVGLKDKNLPGKLGIAHTRWSTHGIPSDYNSHPFIDGSNRFAVVHNGIIENYLELKEGLIQGGVQFSSDTDSEVIVHLIAQAFSGNLQEAVLRVIPMLKGAYALCVMNNLSKEIVGARNGSPLVVGVGKEENFLASDVSAFVEFTKSVIYLNDFELVSINSNNIKIVDFSGKLVNKGVDTVHWDIEQAQKQGYKHFMIKEVMEQGRVVEDQLKVEFNFEIPPKNVHIVACGGAGFAGVLGEYLVEEISKVPCRFYHGSEFRYRNPILHTNDLVIAISQSGETADTLAAIRKAKEHGVKTLAIINVVGSTIAREADKVVYTRAGPEISVASTKAFLAQIVSMYQVAYGLSDKIFEFNGFSNLIEELLELNNSVRELAKKYYLSQNFIYIARNRNFAIALEGALKLKEIAYIHAEAYHAGELKHGPLALVCEDMPTFAICPQDEFYDKTFSNIEEIKARSGKVIVLATAGDEKIKHVANDIIYIPKVDSILYPLMETIPVHLFAYHIADLRECDIDKPRNLAKAVCVE
jgi:glutamine---fructose-6-phosphate transaminase (isomerizing)